MPSESKFRITAEGYGIILGLEHKEVGDYRNMYCDKQNFFAALMLLIMGR